MKKFLIKEIYNFTKVFKEVVIENSSEADAENGGVVTTTTDKKDLTISIDLYIHHDSNRYHMDLNDSFQTKGIIDLTGSPNSFGHLEENGHHAIEFYKWLVEINEFALKVLEPVKTSDITPQFNRNQLAKRYSKQIMGLHKDYIQYCHNSEEVYNTRTFEKFINDIANGI
jgi:hypothetical protein